MRIILTLLLGCLISGVAESAENDAKATFDRAFAVNLPELVKGGRFYTPFYDYVIGPHAVVARGTVFCAFQNSAGRPIVTAYDIDEKSWSKPVQASEFGLGRDAHGNPSICVDGEGHLHVFYGCHGRAMRHTRSARPYDVTAWIEQDPPTDRATYPQTMRMADGTICLFYRAGGHMEPWSSRTSTDNGKTWSEAQRVIEMRLDPPDRLAAAYCQFFPGADGKTIHCFWNHKDDNAARVTDAKPHPWRPLKYKGLHEAVYRYNVYYVRRDADGAWRNAAGEEVELPISRARADAQCLAYDSGDEFTFNGSRQAVDSANRPYFTFGTGVVNWATPEKRVIVPVRQKYLHFASGRWQQNDRRPADWPAEVVRVVKAPGTAAHGGADAAGWSIFSRRTPLVPGTGGTVFLHHDQTGFATRDGGPARIP
ncbi:MAG: BNR-4 repeat-containing protein [Planctomycetes bacterium]|nr:BNR-4 repeat-containing protein [Planctomycetota bacterium]